MNLQKITNISVVLLAVLALIVLGVIIGQGDEYIEMSAMQGNFGAVSVMINLALFVLLVTVLMTLVFSMKNLFSEKSKLKKAGMSIGSFLFVFILAFVLSSGVETPMQDGKMLSALQSRFVEAGIRTFYLLTLIAGGIMVYFSVSKYFKK
jgi:magnesium-transporting ATPase (P-type)|tara:strand:+ start:805 stop:1254 length:450 start_codon:yes stop_codon:yes gene_type:complete